MRIASGRFKGARLASPKGGQTRPTSARIRETMFDILAHGIDGFSFEDTRVLDLFAGTGALGFEALSRGAVFCAFVDQAGPAHATIRHNAESLGVEGQIRVFRRDASRLGRMPAMTSFDLLLADPPYGRGLGEPALNEAAAGGWLAPGAICVLEERQGCVITLPEGFDLLDARASGDTQTVVARFIYRRPNRRSISDNLSST